MPPDPPRNFGALLGNGFVFNLDPRLMILVVVVE